MKIKYTLLAIAFLPLFVFAQINVSNNLSSNDRHPEFSGWGTVWEGDFGGTRRIFYRVGSKIKVIPSNSIYDQSPKTFGNYITWTGFDGNDTEVFYMNISDSTIVQLTDNNEDDLDPKIYNNLITWYGGKGASGGDYEIYYFNGSTVQQLTNNDFDDINPRMGGGDVAWQGFDGNDWEVFSSDGVTVFQRTSNSVDDLNPNVEIGGSNVVWQQFDGSDFEIVFYNGYSTRQITNNAVNDERPATGFNQVTWTANVDGDYDIFFYDRSTIHNISNNDVHDEFLFMRGSSIAWRSYVNAEGEIFNALGTRALQLTFNNFKESNPIGHLKTFVWSGQGSDSGVDEEIYKISANSDQIKLYPPDSMSFSPGTEQTINFDAHGYFEKGTTFSAQLSTLNSETFPVLPVILATSSTNQMTFNVPDLTPGTYHLRIVSVRGGISNTVPIKIFQLPNVFVTSPGDRAINQRVKLNLTSKEVPGASSYTFELTAYASTGQIIMTQTGTRTQSVDSLLYNTVYKVRVKTDLSPHYGKTTIFTTAPAENFTYTISPANGAIDVGMKVNVASNLVLYATSYTIELNTDSLFNSSSAIIKSGGRSLSFSNLSTSTTYYVRIKTNLSPNWGRTHSFTTASALNFSYVVSPSNNATNVSTTPLVKANPITGATIYKIQLCASSDFLSSTLLEKTSTTNAASFSGLQYNTKYFARSSTDLAAGWGRVTSFTTRTASSLAYVKFPTKDATSQPLTLWVKSNIVPGAEHYTIELNTEPDFSGSSIVKFSQNNSIAFPSLNSNTTYYNRVKTDLDSNWGATNKFTTLWLTAIENDTTNAISAFRDEVTVSVHPNTFDQVLNVIVNSPSSEDVELSISDFAGLVSIRAEINTNTLSKIPTDKLNPGLYILRIKSKYNVQTLRVLKL